MMVFNCSISKLKSKEFFSGTIKQPQTLNILLVMNKSDLFLIAKINFFKY